MSARGLLIAAMIALAGCGGAECDPIDLVLGCGSEDDGGAEPVDITIASPSVTGFYVTTDDQVRIAGTASDWDAEIQWVNDAGGAGETSPEYEVCLSCRYDWSVVVPLAVGYNVVTVIASNDAGDSMKSITIRREESFAQWSWVR